MENTGKHWENRHQSVTVSVAQENQLAWGGGGRSKSASLSDKCDKRAGRRLEERTGEEEEEEEVLSYGVHD